MKISDNQIQGALRPFVRQVNNGAKPEAGKKPAATEAAVDRVSLSPEAEEMRAVKQAVLALPDIRVDKVAEIKAALAAGEYQVSAEAIAEKIIGRSIADSLE